MEYSKINLFKRVSMIGLLRFISSGRAHMKRIMMFILTVIALHTGVVSADESIRVLVDGQNLKSDVHPMLINGRTLIPVRAIFEALGLSVGWDPVTRTVVGTKGSLEIRLAIDNDIAQRDSQPIKLDTPATIINERAFVPVRFISENTGARVTWNGETRTVEITQGNGTVQLSPSAPKAVLSATMIGKKADAVVQIHNDSYRGEESQGSGFIVSPDGKIVTNYHVIDLAKSLKIIFNDQTEYTGSVIVLGYDKERDLAVIKIDKQYLPMLQVGNSDSVEMGNDVYTIGSPLGLSNTLSEGIVSAVREDYIQISAPISHGNSGGALLNEYGEVVGVTTAVMNNGENLGFAIPINYVNAFDTARNMTLLEVYQKEYDGTVVDTPVIEQITKVDEHTVRLYMSNCKTADDFVVSIGIHGSDGEHTAITAPKGSYFWDLTDGKYIEIPDLPGNVAIDFVVKGHNHGVYSNDSVSKEVKLGAQSRMLHEDFAIYLKRVADVFDFSDTGFILFFDEVTLYEYPDGSLKLIYYIDPHTYIDILEEVAENGDGSLLYLYATVANEVRDYYKKDVDGYISILDWYDAKPSKELYSSFQKGSVIFYSQKEQKYYIDCLVLWIGTYVEGDPKFYEWNWAKISGTPIVE